MYNADPLKNNINTIGFYSQIDWNFPIRLVKISASLKEKLTGKSVFMRPRDSGKIQRGPPGRPGGPGTRGYRE